MITNIIKSETFNSKFYNKYKYYIYVFVGLIVLLLIYRIIDYIIGSYNESYTNVLDNKSKSDFKTKSESDTKTKSKDLSLNESFNSARAKYLPSTNKVYHNLFGMDQNSFDSMGSQTQQLFADKIRQDDPTIPDPSTNQLTNLSTNPLTNPLTNPSMIPSMIPSMPNLQKPISNNITDYLTKEQVADLTKKLTVDQINTLAKELGNNIPPNATKEDIAKIINKQASDATKHVIGELTTNINQNLSKEQIKQLMDELTKKLNPSDLNDYMKTQFNNLDPTNSKTVLRNIFKEHAMKLSPDELRMFLNNVPLNILNQILPDHLKNMPSTEITKFIDNLPQKELADLIITKHKILNKDQLKTLINNIPADIIGTNIKPTNKSASELIISASLWLNNPYAKYDDIDNIITELTNLPDKDFQSQKLNKYKFLYDLDMKKNYLVSQKYISDRIDMLKNLSKLSDPIVNNLIKLLSESSDNENLKRIYSKIKPMDKLTYESYFNNLGLSKDEILNMIKHKIEINKYLSDNNPNKKSNMRLSCRIIREEV